MKMIITIDTESGEVDIEHVTNVESTPAAESSNNPGDRHAKFVQLLHDHGLGPLANLFPANGAGDPMIGRAPGGIELQDALGVLRCYAMAMEGADRHYYPLMAAAPWLDRATRQR